MARRLPPEVPNEGFNMTPMIDITFQLLIFFMLVTDMARAQIEPLTLPTAGKAIKEKFEDSTCLILNILKDGTVKAGGKTLWIPKLGDEDGALVNAFQKRREMRKYQEIAGKSDGFVKYPVLIRADRSTPFEHIQKILMIATHHGGVTRVQLGAKQEVK